jgi:hypothetical protein
MSWRFTLRCETCKRRSLRSPYCTRHWRHVEFFRNASYWMYGVPSKILWTQFTYARNAEMFFEEINVLNVSEREKRKSFYALFYQPWFGAEDVVYRLKYQEFKYTRLYVVIPVVLYGCETWSLTLQNKKDSTCSRTRCWTQEGWHIWRLEKNT